MALDNLDDNRNWLNLDNYVVESAHREYNSNDIFLNAANLTLMNSYLTLYIFFISSKIFHFFTLVYRKENSLCR